MMIEHIYRVIKSIYLTLCYYLVKNVNTLMDKFFKLDLLKNDEITVCWLPWYRYVIYCVMIFCCSLF